MMNTDHVPNAMPASAAGVAQGCEACPLQTDRRRFLRDMVVAVAGTLAVISLSPHAAFADGVRVMTPLANAGTLRRYEVPRVDGVSIDGDNDVILARWQQRVYAFSLLCPHRGAKLVWHADESRVFCPKHRARFRPDGAHDSGRQTRALDRYDVRLEGTAIVVDLGTLHQQDEDPAGWRAAVVAVG
jgi:nitrite reductase/ring-hydroxylating ferredoxin subunit